MRRAGARWRVSWLVLLVVVVASGHARALPAPRIDGAFEEWQAPLEARADAQWIYLRFTLPEAVNLQSAPQVVRVLIDADADTASGRRFRDTPEGLGPEVFVSFSSAASGRGRGTRVRLVTPDGDEHLPPAALGVVTAPTTSSRSFEMRVARRVKGHPEWQELLDAGPVRLAVIAGRERGVPAWRSEIIEIAPPPAGPAEDAAAPLPSPPRDGLRVVSWNVLWGRPLADPAPFVRVLGGLAPDLVLLQEWDRGTGADLQAWFDKHMDGRWYVMRSAGWGVAIASRTPLVRVGAAQVDRPPGARPDWNRPGEAVRVVAARTQTRLGPVALASMHLRCCGHDGSPEDEARVAEAEVIRSALLDAGFGSGEGLRLIGGDLNLVGSTRPLETLRRGMGPGGSDLHTASVRRLVGTADYTWRNPRSEFTPGRLDWIAWGGDRARVATAFVIDAHDLSDRALAEAGMRATDTDVSDHLPMVVDFRAG